MIKYGGGRKDDLKELQVSFVVIVVVVMVFSVVSPCGVGGGLCQGDELLEHLPLVFAEALVQVEDERGGEQGAEHEYGPIATFPGAQVAESLCVQQKHHLFPAPAVVNEERLGPAHDPGGVPLGSAAPREPVLNGSPSIAQPVPAAGAATQEAM